MICTGRPSAETNSIQLAHEYTYTHTSTHILTRTHAQQQLQASPAHSSTQRSPYAMSPPQSGRSPFGNPPDSSMASRSPPATEPASTLYCSSLSRGLPQASFDSDDSDVVLVCISLCVRVCLFMCVCVYIYIYIYGVCLRLKGAPHASSDSDDSDVMLVCTSLCVRVCLLMCVYMCVCGVCVCGLKESRRHRLTAMTAMSCWYVYPCVCMIVHVYVKVCVHTIITHPSHTHSTHTHTRSTKRTSASLWISEGTHGTLQTKTVITVHMIPRALPAEGSQ
jgi:hypothetical protein